MPTHRLLPASRRLILPVAMGVLAVGAAGCGSSEEPKAKPGSAMSAPAKGTAVDAAFVRQMIPHHELALEMAKLAKAQATHADVKALAKAILTTQQSEIDQMRVAAKAGGHAIGDPNGMMDADAKTLGMGMDATGMSMSAGTLNGARPFDRAFLDMMIPHHEGAVRMARVEAAHGSSAELQELAARIIRAQQREIAQMKRWRASWYPGQATDNSADGHMSGHDMSTMQ